MQRLILLLTICPLALAINLIIPSNPNGTRVPSNFTNLSAEYQGVDALFLANERLPNPEPQQAASVLASRMNYVFLQLLSNIVQPTNSTLLFRIGGNSANRIQFAGSTLPPLPAQFNVMPGMILTPYTFQILNKAAEISGIKLVMDIGMPTSQPIYAQELIDSIKANIKLKHIHSFEIGNEPKGWRPIGYNFSTFMQEYKAYSDLVTKAFGQSVDLFGPSYADTWISLNLITPFINNSSAKFISFHSYGVDGCALISNINNMLDSPGLNEYQFVSDLSAQTIASGKINVWGEGNSVSCRGLLGISNVFASALWTVDMMLEMAFRGVQLAFLSGAPQVCIISLNITFQALYAPIDISKGIVNVRPGYYGMLLFNIAIGQGDNSLVYRADGDSTLRLKSWGVYNPVTTVHTIVIIHKSTNPDEPYQITIPGGVVGQLITLTAPSLTSTSGFTIAGLTFDGTQDGMPTGTYNETLVKAVNNVFSFIAIQGSISMLRVQLDVNATLSPIVKFESKHYPSQGKLTNANGTLKPPTSSATRSRHCLIVFAIASLVTIIY